MESSIVFDSLVGNSPIAAGMFGMAWLLVKYMRERDQQNNEAWRENAAAVRQLAETIARLEGRLSQ